MFRQLTETEKTKFRQWARANYVPHTEINSVWHPVVQSECHRINEEIKFQADKTVSKIPENLSPERK